MKSFAAACRAACDGKESLVSCDVDTLALVAQGTVSETVLQLLTTDQEGSLVATPASP